MRPTTIIGRESIAIVRDITQESLALDDKISSPSRSQAVSRAQLSDNDCKA
jgi:hypothetical protein